MANEGRMLRNKMLREFEIWNINDLFVLMNFFAWDTAEDIAIPVTEVTEYWRWEHLLHMETFISVDLSSIDLKWELGFKCPENHLSFQSNNHLHEVYALSICLSKSTTYVFVALSPFGQILFNRISRLSGAEQSSALNLLPCPSKVPLITHSFDDSRLCPPPRRRSCFLYRSSQLIFTQRFKILQKVMVIAIPRSPWSTASTWYSNMHFGHWNTVPASWPKQLEQRRDLMLAIRSSQGIHWHPTAFRTRLLDLGSQCVHGHHLLPDGAMFSCLGSTPLFHGSKIECCSREYTVLWNTRKTPWCCKVYVSWYQLSI